METVPTEQFLKLKKHMRYLEEENARKKVENAALAGQLHDIHETFDYADNKDIKEKGRREDKEEDEESEVQENRRHGFRDQMWAEFQEFKKVIANEV